MKLESGISKETYCNPEDIASLMNHNNSISMDKNFQEIYDFISSLYIIDTHEHLPGREEKRSWDTDILKEYLIHYFNRDLLSAGLRPNELAMAKNEKLPLVSRWKLVEPYWKVSKYTGYGQSIRITLKALYGCDDLCESNIEKINELFLKTLEPGHYEKVLKGMSKIVLSLIDTDLECDYNYFRSVYRMDSFIFPTCGADIIKAQEISGLSMSSFERWMDACETVLDYAIKKGAVAIKCAIAYNRSLSFPRVSRKEAEDDFNRMISSCYYIEQSDQKVNAGQSFQNYMMHYLLNLLEKRDKTFQVHTGMQEGSGNILSNSDPSLLNNLIFEYPDVDFDLLHIGFPYHNVMGALAKVFPNVFINMSWAHIISPDTCIRMLVEWLGTVPYSKISAFGGDYCMIDPVYGHQFIARKNVAIALTKKVNDKTFDIDTAKEIGKAMFYDNPVRILKLDNILN